MLELLFHIIHYTLYYIYCYPYFLRRYQILTNKKGCTAKSRKMYLINVFFFFKSLTSFCLFAHSSFPLVQYFVIQSIKVNYNPNNTHKCRKTDVEFWNLCFQTGGIKLIFFCSWCSTRFLPCLPISEIKIPNLTSPWQMV